MTDTRFYDKKGPFSLEQLVQNFPVTLVGNGADEIHDVSALQTATPQDLVFFDKKKAPKDLNWQTLAAGAVLVSPDTANEVPAHLNKILTDKPYATFARMALKFFPFLDRSAEVQTAALHPSAKIAKTALLSPGVVVGRNAEIGEACFIGPNVTVGPGVKIGAGSTIQAGVCLSHVVLGNGVTIAQGTAIGQGGFGFMMDGDEPVDFPQLGRVIIGDNVIIGANCTIDRGSLTDTLIGSHSRIDNLVQIAHGVKIGKGCIIVAQVGIAGSTTIGDFTVIAGQVGIVDHLTIGKNVRIAAQSGVMRHIEDGVTVGGTPAVPIMEWRKQCLALTKLIQKPKPVSTSS